MYTYIENKALLDDINKLNISPQNHTERQVIELLKVIYPMRMPFIHLFTKIRRTFLGLVWLDRKYDSRENQTIRMQTNSSEI